MRSYVKIVPMLLFAATVCGCRLDNYPAMDVWLASDMVNLTDRTPSKPAPLLFDVARGQVKLFAAANETVSFQVVVDGGAEGVQALRISSDPLRDRENRIAADNVRIFRGLPIHVSKYPPWYLRLVDAVPRAADFYDPLVPITSEKAGQPFWIKPNGRMVFWVDVRVPRRTKAGRYVGRLYLSSDSRKRWSVELRMDVYDFVLPDARPVMLVGGFDYAEIFRAFVKRDAKPFVPSRLDPTRPLVREGLVLYRQLMRMAHEHRLDLFDKRIHPIMKRDMFGKVRLDWRDYDSIVRPYLSGTAFDDRIGSAAWPVPFSENWPQPQYYGGPNSDAYAATVAELLAACRKHFASMGASGQMFVWPYRGGVNAEAYEKYIRMARIARLADNETPILSSLPATVPRQTGWRVPREFASLTNIFAPRAEWLDPALAAKTRNAENPLTGLWLSPGTPPYLPGLGVIATPADVRAFAWFAMKYKCTGMFLPEVLHWDEHMTGPGDIARTRLFYPGSIVGLRQILPSIRLKRLRRGLQDLAYLWILRQRHRGGIADAIINAMVRYGGRDAAGDNYLDPRLGGWVKDPASWQLVRKLLAEEVQDAVKPTAMSTRRLLAQRLAWRQFNERTRTVRVEQVRSRVTGGDKGMLHVTVQLDLYNEYSRGVDVLVKLGRLPAGWQAVKGTVELAPMPPASRKVVTLSARGTYVPVQADAKMPLPISLTIDHTKRKQLHTSVPFLLAGHSEHKIKIDGNLDDWPMRTGNTAGDFKLIGARGRHGDGLAKRQTLAFVLFDKKNLYIAFRCNEPQPDRIVAMPNNIIHYEQLMASGEDLVEVILDPGQRAKGPQDLFHILVKANGILLTERGVHTSPPLGKARAWPVSMSVAVRRQKDVWIVEMSIPRAAFGPAGKAAFWGVNFTRFATQGNEASSWAGAPRYFYDPKNLGTMFVTPTKTRARNH